MLNWVCLLIFAALVSGLSYPVLTGCGPTIIPRFR